MLKKKSQIGRSAFIINNNIKKRYFLFLFILLPMMVSCTTAKFGEDFQNMYWNFQKNMREPGEKLVSHPNKVWKKHNCRDQKLPFLQIQKNEILPVKLNAGEEVNHHLTYAMCPAKPSQVISGRMTRTVYYKGEIVFSDVTKNFEIKPGEWCIDAFIKIPVDAEPGVYSIEVLFSSNQKSFKKYQNFIVKKTI